MIIPGFVISILTFPGVVVHELAHQLFCRWCKIPVYQVVYFQMKNPCGYVLHERTNDPVKNFLTAMGPFFINTVLGALLILPGSVQVVAFRSIAGTGSILNLLLVWIGISVLMHAFPSTGDAKSMVSCILKNPEVSVPAKILAAPFIGLIYLGAIGSMFWLDLVYAIAVALAIPNLILLFL